MATKTKKPITLKKTKFVLKYRKIKNCPNCGSKRVEESWGTGGYMQCNACGSEYAKSNPQKKR